MKFCNKLVLLLPLVASTTVLAEVASLSISYRANQFSGGTVAKIEVISEEDLLEIENIIVNRNNCALRPTFEDALNGNNSAVKKKTLKYGQKTRYELNNCNVREIILETNHGTHTFTVNR